MQIVDPSVVKRYMKLFKLAKFDQAREMFKPHPDLELALDSLPNKYKEYMKSFEIKKGM